MDSSVSPKDEIWFLRVCQHVSTGLYYVPVMSGTLWLVTGQTSLSAYSRGAQNFQKSSSHLNILSTLWINVKKFPQYGRNTQNVPQH
jgi:hypothetical protein